MGLLTFVMTVCPPWLFTKSETEPEGALSRVLPPAIACHVGAYGRRAGGCIPMNWATREWSYAVILHRNLGRRVDERVGGRKVGQHVA